MDVFGNWLAELADERAAARIMVRVDRLARGNFGDHRPVGNGVWELRIDYGPGYRVYYMPGPDERLSSFSPEATRGGSLPIFETPSRCGKIF